MTSSALSPKAFLSLLLIACMFASNHVAARIAFDHGVNVVTAVAVRSLGTALVVALLVWGQRAPVARWSTRHKGFMLLIGLLIGVQSACLYAAVARLPVGLALLVFNSYPIWATLAARILYGRKPERAALIAMPVILIGLALALNVVGLFGSQEARATWASSGPGIGFALGAGVTFGLVLALTQHEVADLDGRVRSAFTMGLVGVLAAVVATATGAWHWPAAAAGWGGLAALTVLYGTAFTAVFTLLPKLGAVSNSPILNIEPVAALLLAWAVLGQVVSPLQFAGALIVVGAVMALGLRKK
ncbi:MAG: DMT family transporter [Burkholderiaceae bacterium]|nr:DMT family transporter [Burkholderiaceae bacterium]